MFELKREKQRAPGTEPERMSNGEMKSVFETLGTLIESGGITIDILEHALEHEDITLPQFKVLNRKLHERKDADNKELKDELERAHIDGLTSLFMRKYLEPDMEKKIRELDRSESKRGVLFVLFDIDYFKQLNDTYGHQVGDRALAIVGDRLRGIGHRSGDSAYRYGGEELALVLTIESEKEVSDEMVETLADAKQEELNRLLFIEVKDEETNMSKKVPITLSMGFAFFKKGDKRAGAVETLKKSADQKLYKNKGPKAERLAAAQKALELM